MPPQQKRKKADVASPTVRATRARKKPEAAANESHLRQSSLTFGGASGKDFWWHAVQHAAYGYGQHTQ